MSTKTNVMSKLPSKVADAIRQRYGLEEGDESQDAYLSTLGPSELFDMFCSWYGLLGWGRTLEEALAEIRKAKRS